MGRFLTTALVVLSTSALASNALFNGSFEKGLDGWTNDGGQSTSDSKDGESACMIRQGSPRWSGVGQKVTIPAGVKTVKVTGWMRSDSVRGGAESWERGRLSIVFHDAKNDTVGGYPMAVGQVRGRTAWTRMERSYPVPARAAWLNVECALANATGTLYCDDISVEFER